MCQQNAGQRKKECVAGKVAGKDRGWIRAHAAELDFVATELRLKVVE